MVIWHGIRDALLMGWQILWALVLGFTISAAVQAWVPRERVTARMSGSGPRPVGLAAALGAASSSCSYAAVAISKSLFSQGASASTAVAFEFASTNLVWELGAVLWVLLGWQFTLAEYLGGVVMIVLAALLVRRLIPERLQQQARRNAGQADAGHVHTSAGGQGLRLRSLQAWSDLAHNLRGDLTMLWKEIALGLLISGFVAQLPAGFWHGLFLRGAPHGVQILWGAVIGPLIAVASSVCSVGNIPLAAVLWSGGISFAGVIAFIFADLLIVPIVLIRRKYYGAVYAARVTALMAAAIVLAALVTQAIFSALGLIPGGARPTHSHVFGSVAVGGTLVLNVVALLALGGLWTLTLRRGALDPVCGMTVDRARALTAEHGGRRWYFCCEGCRAHFRETPDAYSEGRNAPELPVAGKPPAATSKHTTLRW